jgi:predicted O-methyltransferase YrrM
MSNRTLSLDDRLYDYLLRHSLREPPTLAALRAETASHPQVNMQSQHTDEILGAHGFSPAEIAQLRANGTV